MKITYICNEYPPVPHGGIGTFVHTMAHAMAKEGHEVLIIGYNEKPVNRYDNNVHVITLPEYKFRGLGWIINRMKLYFWLLQKVSSENIDLIESPEFAGLLPFPFKKCPVIVRLHLSATAINRQAQIPPKGMQPWCEKRMLKYHRNWIGVSHYILELTKKTFRLEPYRSTIIYNPVTVPVADNIILPELPEKYILFAGTVTERKGAVVLAEAFKRVVNTDNKIHLIYAGHIGIGADRKVGEKIKNILGPKLIGQVHFVGSLDRVRVIAYMKKATLVAYPSRLESFGFIPLEAMASGTPVIYSSYGPGPEIINHGVDGLLVDPYNADDIAEKIFRILKDAEFAQYLTKNAKKSIIEKFSLELCVKRSLEFYDQCL
jgi:glycosyltransferase involved in cell wall biosynthesis